MKKKLDSANAGRLTKQKKLILWIMKKSLFFFISFFSITSFGYTQNFSLNLGKVSLHEGFDKIKKAGKVTMFYSDNELDVERVVRVKYNNKTALEMVADLVGPSFEAKLVDKSVIVIVPVSKEVSIKETLIQQEQNDITVSGTVVGELEGSLPGVTVKIKGTSKIVSTDVDGNFSLQIPAEGGVLVVSYIGYITQEVKVSKSSKLKIVLIQETAKLSEVVVMGYTSQKAAKVTGAVTVLKADKLKDVTEGNVQDMLQGKVAGVLVTGTSGDPNSSGNVRIRGIGTISANTAPLYVVDGVVGGIVNPSDVESMTILKDAAATTLYGSKAANGVIVITTKKGKSGKTVFDVKSIFGTGTATHGNFKVMNSFELYNHLATSIGNEWENLSSPTKPSKAQYIESKLAKSVTQYNTNWNDLAYRTAITRLQEVNMSGGTEKTRFYWGNNYYNEEGISIGTGIKRFGSRLNLNHDLNDKFKMNLNVGATITSSENNNGGAVGQSYTNLPWDRAYDDNGIPIDPKIMPTGVTWYGRDQANFVFDSQYNTNTSNSTNLDVLFKLDYKINTDFSFSSTNRINSYNYNSKNYSDVRSTGGRQSNGSLGLNNGRDLYLLTSNMVKYDHKFDKHTIDGIAGVEYSEKTFKNNSSLQYGFLPGISVPDVGAIPIKVEGTEDEDLFLSGFGQANYSYNDRYFFTSSFRRDGSSRFGTNNKYANFWALGGSWVATNEEFMKNLPVISNLKVRSSYGTTGNVSSNLYGGLTYYGAGGTYNQQSTLSLSQIGNPDLSWELSNTFDLGMDISILKNRISFTVDYYNRVTDGLLFAVPQPSTVGITSIWENVGKVKNTGYEFTLTTKNFNREFKWTTDFNISFNKNRLLELYDGKTELTSSWSGQRLYVGEDIHTWYMRKWAGVDPANGDPLWEMVSKDANGVEQITKTNNYNNATLQKTGSSTPDFYGGLKNELTYKGIEFDFLIVYMSGNDVYHSSREFYDSDGAYGSYNSMNLKEGWNRWEKPGDIATHPRLLNNGNKNAHKQSTRFLEDGSYARLRNVTLAYNFPKEILKKINFSQLRLSLQGDNLYTLTKFSGVDPETDDNGNVGSRYPFAKKVLIGVQVGF